MKSHPVLMVAVAALLIFPFVIGETSEAAADYVTHTVTFKYADGTVMYDTEVIDGRTIGNSQPWAYEGAPYWCEWTSGYYWPIDKAVTYDVCLKACDERPPDEPADNTALGLAAGVGFLAVILGLIVYVTYRRH